MNTTETARGESVRQGMRYARQCFASRGNHSEIHITEADLAARFALMYEQGYKTCNTGLLGALEVIAAMAATVLDEAGLTGRMHPLASWLEMIHINADVAIQKAKGEL